MTRDLVSAVCLSRDRVRLLRRAVACFLGQTYQPRELIVVRQADDASTRDYLDALHEPAIRSLEVPAEPRLTVGALRNLALEATRGDIVATWDDDDWHAPTRLAEQVGALRESGRPGCVLLQVILYDAVTRTAFLSARRTWEGSLVAERASIPPFPALQQGSDTPVIAQMLEQRLLVLLERPRLYVYIHHGGNNWNRQHWENQLVGHARRPLTPAETAEVQAWLGTPD